MHPWRIAIIPGLVLAVGWAGSAGAPMRPQECVDGRDNDKNRLVDLRDPSCLSEADYHEGPLTKAGATAEARGDATYKFLDGKARGFPRIKVNCRAASRGSFRCAFTFRQRFRYRGVITVKLVRYTADNGDPGEVAEGFFRSYRGRCGVVPAEVGLYDVRVAQTTCQTGRTVTRRWLRKVFNGSCTRFNCLVKGDYSCQAKRPARVRYRVVCRRPHGEQVRFTVVAD